MYRKKVTSGVLEAASNFASARSLCYVRADCLDLAGQSDLVPEHTATATAQHPVPMDVDQQAGAAMLQLETGSSSPTAAAAAQLWLTAAKSLEEPVQALLQLQTSSGGPGSPQQEAVKLPSPMLRMSKVEDPGTPATSDAPSRTPMPNSPEAAGSQQATSTRLNAAAVCPPAQQGSKRKVTEMDAAGSESPSSPCPDDHVAQQRQRTDASLQLLETHQSVQQQPAPALHALQQRPPALCQGPWPALQLTSAQPGSNPESVPSWERPWTRDSDAHARAMIILEKFRVRCHALKAQGQVRLSCGQAAVFWGCSVQLHSPAWFLARSSLIQLHVGRRQSSPCHTSF